jgi:hypothetical protein
MSDWIPGIQDQLGWGINIFGSYFPSAHHPSSKLQNQLLDATATGVATEEITINGVTYKKPVNVAVDSGHAFSGETFVFEDKSKVVEHWQEEAKVEGSYGAFSGGFKESFSSSSESESSLFYCIHEASSLVYSLDLRNPSAGMIAKSVQDDPDFASLQDLLNRDQGINDNNKNIYFKFFHKYGTHIITSVRMGGYLNYYASAASSYSQSKQEFKSQVNAEYAALFKGSGSAEWGKVADKWMSTRQAKLIGYGGNPASKLVSDIFSNWTKDTDYSSDFKDWVSSVPNNPSPVGFSLYPVSSLFAGHQAELVHGAYLEYASAQISISITNTLPVHISVSWQGKTLVVPEPGEGDVQGAFWILIDRANGKSTIVPQPTITQPYKYQDLSKVPDQVMKQSKGTSLVIFCTPVGRTGGPTPGRGNPPKEPLLSFLRQCGAGAALNDMLSWRGWSETVYGHGFYCLLGQIGAGPETGEEVQTLTQPVKFLNWDTPIIPIWDGHKMLYSILNW